MRGKEDAHDYRYFPCPDLVPIAISEEWIEEVRAQLPELPDQRKFRLMDEYGLPVYDAVLLTADRELADYFEDTVSNGGQAKKVANWIMTELLRELKGDSITVCKVSPWQLASLLEMVQTRRISGKIAKTVFQLMMQSGKDPLAIVQDQNLLQVSDEGELVELVRRIIGDNPVQAEAFRNGKTKIMGFFVGQLMQRTNGKANPNLANELFNRELSS